MTDQSDSEGSGELREAAQRVQNLQLRVFNSADPSANDELLQELSEASAKLEKLEAKRVERRREAAEKADKPSRPSSKTGRYLGEKTTELIVETTITMDPIPTGAYNLMDPETDPLVVVRVKNVSRKIRRVCVTAYIEGVSAQAVKTVEIEEKGETSFSLQPTLFPESVHRITEIQRATLHVIVDDLDGRLERHDTYPVTCLARTASFNSVRRPDTGEYVDLSHYYGAWVTPYVTDVQELVRRAAELTPNRQMVGYQENPDRVQEQVSATYDALRQAEIIYINSVIDYGAQAGMSCQRTRLPRESLQARSANCIDGTVLMASVLEGASLNPAIVLVPGHAFLGWEVWSDSDDWKFLETTMIGNADFDAACASGQKLYDQFAKNPFNQGKIKVHSLADLRSRRIWPME